jgi:hypothetical protein
MEEDSMVSEATMAPGGRDWRIWFGLTSTLFWLCLGLLYVAFVIGFRDFVTQPADALGGFLEGAFAPLAFLWLVLGFFLQQRELRTNNQAIHAQYEQMRRTAESSEIQARAIRANALHQQQETTMMIADRVHRQLASVVGLLWMSSQGPGNTDAAPEELITRLWTGIGTGDDEGFARQFMALYFGTDEAGARDLFFGTPTRERHSRTVVEIFGRLLETIRPCDPDGVIEDAVLGSGHGRLYQIIRETDPQPPN